jgi:RNA polymerase sigma factor (sigma-70 family)
MVESHPAAHLGDAVRAAQGGDLDAYGRLVQATQQMALAVAVSVLREQAAAEDAVQQAYLRAFRRLADVREPAAFPGWLRRIVVTVALNMRRARRRTLLCVGDIADVPVLDEEESRWTDLQRHRLAAALLTLTPEERRICDRRYHGGWSIGRLAVAARVDEPAMRKRLQRIRDKLRKEIEMTEHREARPASVSGDLPRRIVELLARPRLTDLPENPVGSIAALLQSAYPGFREQTLPEIVDVGAAPLAIVREALYIGAHELHRIDERRILRYDLTLPLLLTVRYEGEPLRLWAAGKAYRIGQVDAMHLEAFHQADVLWMDERGRVDAWQLTGRVLQSIDAVLPGRVVKMVPAQYPMCTQAWDLEVDDDGHWIEVMAWGVFTDAIVRHLGGDPARHVAVGVGYGLERLAMLRYGIDDARKIDVTSVA